jgi:hypothetical protein
VGIILEGWAWLALRVAHRLVLSHGEGTLAMKRDMDLIRQIMFELEKQAPRLDYHPPEIQIEGHSKGEVVLHVKLLDEAGYIKAQNDSTLAELSYIPIRLTWQGYEFLDAARDDTRWNKAKDVMDKAGGFVFEVAKALLIELLKQQVMPTKP